MCNWIIGSGGTTFLEEVVVDAGGRLEASSTIRLSPGVWDVMRLDWLDEYFLR